MLTLPKRNDIDEKNKWNLESIYPTDAAWEADFVSINEKLPGLEAFKDKLGESGKALFSGLQMYEKIMMNLEQVYVYASMRRDEDNTNGTYQALADRAASLYSQAAASASFITPEIVAIPEDKLASFYQDEPRLAHYRFMLDQILREKPHTRSAEVEEVLAQAYEVTSAPDRIFSMMTDADFKYGNILDENEQEVELTNGRFINFLESTNRRVRKDAFEAKYKVYGNYNNTLASTYAASVKADIFQARTHHYKSSLEAKLKPHNIPEEVYTNLLQAVDRNLPSLHRYLKLRKEVLRLDELHMYDLYVPLVSEASRKIPYSEAVEIVTDGLGKLGQQYIADMTKGINSRWIDVYESTGKTSGAYSSGSYTTQPFILLNHQDNLYSTYTLAHELGHSMHSFYTNKNQPYTYSNYSLFVAEVASITNEALLTDYLLENTTDRAMRMYLINTQLEQYRGTLFRQVLFAEFEYEAHKRAEEGHSLTPELLNNIYRSLIEKYYGPVCFMDEQIALEWSRIPHFYSSFYVYQYATGMSAAVSLSQQIIQEGQPAVDRYLNFLRSGSSDYPANILKTAGVDMTTPEPVQQALDYFSKLLDEFEQLALEPVGV